MTSVMFDDVTLVMPVGIEPVSMSTPGVWDPWQDSMLREMLILINVKPDREGFNTTWEYIAYWDEYLSYHYGSSQPVETLMGSDPGAAVTAPAALPGDPWQGSALRQLLINVAQRPSRESFNSTWEYIAYWDEYLSDHYDGLSAARLGASKTYSFYDYSIPEVVWRWVSYVFETPFSILLSGFGMVSNTVVIVVFYRMGVLSDSCTTILTAIGVSDSVYCLLTLAMYVTKLPLVVKFITDRENYHPSSEFQFLHRILEIPIDVLNQFNCLVAAYLAFERMICVSYPFRVRRYFNPRRSSCILACLLGISCLANFHNIFGVELVVEESQSGGGTVVYVKTNDLISFKTSTIGYVIKSCVIRPTSIVLNVLFNGIIIVKVRRAKRFLRTIAPNFATGAVAIMSSSTSASAFSNVRRKETKLIRVIFGVSVMVVVCYSPRMFADICVMITSCPPVVTLHITNYTPVLELANSCFNACIYYVLSSRFKQELKQIGSCCKNRQ